MIANDIHKYNIYVNIYTAVNKVIKYCEIDDMSKEHEQEIADLLYKIKNLEVGI